MRDYLIIFSFLISLSSGAEVRGMGARWNIQVEKNEHVMTVPTQGTLVTLLTRKQGGDVTFVAKDAPAYSISRVKAKLSEFGGIPVSLKVIPSKLSKNPTVFVFRSKDQIHWFSTRGSYLTATVDEKNLSDSEYEILVKKVRWK